MPPIDVEPNPGYAQPSGSNKYSPLKSIFAQAADSANYINIINGRKNQLQAWAAFPANLNLVVRSWAAVTKAERGSNPPIVVVSSNRSGWISGGLARAQAQAQALGIGRFNNISDLRALEGPANATDPVSPPIYCPIRLAAAHPRNVYVLVNYREYDAYQQNLEGRGVTVVGWSFRTAAAVAPDMLSGFGASRYAAIAFCKLLRHKAGNPWNSAWMFDDNVTAIKGLSGLDAIEGGLGANICASFRARSQPRNRRGTRDFAHNYNPPAQRDGTGIPAPGPAGNQGIIQQATLWNIASIVAGNVNFSPIFVASKEDVSLTNYFEVHPTNYQFYTNEIQKEQVASVAYDNGAGANAVNAARVNYTDAFAALEGPVQVRQRRPAPVGAATQIDQYMTNVVVPGAAALQAMINAKPAAQRAAATQAYQREAVCRGIESIMNRAIRGQFPNARTTYTDAATLAAIFQAAAAGAGYGATLTVTAREV